MRKLRPRAGRCSPRVTNELVADRPREGSFQAKKSNEEKSRVYAWVSLFGGLVTPLKHPFLISRVCSSS